MIQEDNTKAMGQFRIFKVPSELETNFNNSKLAFNDVFCLLVLVISILLKTIFWQTSIQRQSVVKMS